MKIAIVIQGASTNVVEQKNAWRNYLNDVIFSTWIGEEYKYDFSDKVVFNIFPQDPGPMNFNFQVKSTLNGLIKAKELGYTHALKIRGDLIPTDDVKFMSVLDSSKINFLCWHAHNVYPNCPGYLIDYLMSGQIDELINLWSIEDNFCVVPEVILTKSFIDNFSMSDLNFFLKDLDDNNNLFWIKRNILLSQYKITISDPYNKYSFTDDMQYLTKDYIKKFL
jgi:hypothetical protein